MRAGSQHCCYCCGCHRLRVKQLEKAEAEGEGVSSPPAQPDATPPPAPRSLCWLPECCSPVLQHTGALQCRCLVAAGAARSSWKRFSSWTDARGPKRVPGVHVAGARVLGCRASTEMQKAVPRRCRRRTISSPTLRFMRPSNMQTPPSAVLASIRYEQQPRSWCSSSACL